MKLLKRGGQWSSLLLLTGVIALWGCNNDEETGEQDPVTPTNEVAGEQITLDLTGMT